MGKREISAVMIDTTDAIIWVYIGLMSTGKVVLLAPAPDLACNYGPLGYTNDIIAKYRCDIPSE